MLIIIKLNNVRHIADLLEKKFETNFNLKIPITEFIRLQFVFYIRHHTAQRHSTG